ncbi:hypothetical protein EUGRSUZ_G01932 [Eucalyptus grandis]|uniref:Uncharacterized protein n=2 Tax=Eucalyptus grandis TaxID=71139 RepID=A0ACC3K5D6_EUCGR|nr:hypothetical protein EUGRSUZ_G01932 [Eucalyptus grandis]
MRYMSFWRLRGSQFHILHFLLSPPTRIHSIHVSYDRSSKQRWTLLNECSARRNRTPKQGCHRNCTVHRLKSIHL